MKTIDPTAPITAALSKRAGLETEIQDLNQRAADSTARLAALESGCDLGDDKALAEITRLQVMTNLFPRRLSVREQAFAETETEILQACHGLISNDLSPRLRELLNKARAKAEAALKPHFSLKPDLEQAVEKSATVSELAGLYASTSIQGSPLGGVLAYAQRLLEIWQRINQIENKLA